jgi:ABC-2 type transport system permease protein
MHHLKLIRSFFTASAQSELAYRANFWISLFHSVLELATGGLGLVILFNQVDSINGWDLPATLSLLGVYLTLNALRSLFLGPSLEALSGMDGEVWTGRLDYTILRPVDIQFQATFRYWRPLAFLDLGLALGVLALGGVQIGSAATPTRLLAFFLTMGSGLTILYAFLLAFAGMVFWSPGFLFTWVFDGLFQLARFPLSLYPGWLRLILTWVVPVGMMTTFPIQALSSQLSLPVLGASLMLAVGLVIGASILFRSGIKRYASASS